MSINLMLSRLCRRHFTRIVLLIVVTYFIFAIRFFGSPSEEPASHLDKEQTTELSEFKDSYEEQQKISVKGKSEKETQPVFQAIDQTEADRARRLQVLKEIYAVPHPGDDVYKLNESLSRTIDLDRKPNDLRPEACKIIKYDIDSLPTVSVIFPIYNEALSMLLRAVHSVINNTPQHLLVDVILVDDDSKNENLKEPLERYVALLPSKVRIIRNKKREGLIRARMRGANEAKGEVLMFQDVHTEMSEGWAEPILSYIQSHPKTVVQPLVEELQVNRIEWPKRDEISHDDMWRGVFMWDMRYAWNLIPKKYSSWQQTKAEPWPNPVLVGCSLAVSREWFDLVGGFDQGLNIWGGENIELSLRTWMCGGRMVIHPCGRIAHVFKPFSYTFDGDKETIIAKNSVRVVETWMDEQRDYFYATNYIYPYKQVELDEEEKESLRKHKALRKKLNCKSFSWYLENVLPEMNLPSKDMIHFGEVQNFKSKACWLVHADGYVTTTLDCYTYSRLKHDQEFGLTRGGQLMYYGKCVAVTKHLLFRAGTCGSSTNENGWSFEVDEQLGQQVGVLKYTFSDGRVKCAQQVTNIVEVHLKEQMPQLLACRSGDIWQKWYITYNLGYHLVPNRPV